MTYEWKSNEKGTWSYVDKRGIPQGFVFWNEKFPSTYHGAVAGHRDLAGRFKSLEIAARYVEGQLAELDAPAEAARHD